MQTERKFSQTWIRELTAELQHEDKPNLPVGDYKDTHHLAGGLRLRVSKKKLTFYIQGRIRGRKDAKPTTYTIGDAVKMHLGTARKTATKWSEMLQSGKDPRIAFKNAVNSVTLEKCHNDYLADKDKIKEDTKREYENTFAYARKYRLNIKHMHEILYDDILDLHAKITAELNLKKEHKKRQADKTVNHIRALFTFAKNEYFTEDRLPLITTDPTQKFKNKGKFNYPNGQALRKQDGIEPDQMHIVYDAINGLENYRAEYTMRSAKVVRKPSKYMYVISRLFKFMLFTGWRGSEASGIEWNQVDFNKKTISFRDEAAIERMKVKDEVINFPLNSYAWEAIEDMRKHVPDNCPWVFPNSRFDNRTHANNEKFTIYLSDTMKKLHGIDARYSAGVFRKVFITYGEWSGVNKHTIQRLVLHTFKHSDVTSGYIMADIRYLRKQSQRVADTIIRAINGEDVFAEESALEKSINIADVFLEQIEVISNSTNKSKDEVLEEALKKGIIHLKMEHSLT